jgi:hypothetical protein
MLVDLIDQPFRFSAFGVKKNGVFKPDIAPRGLLVTLPWIGWSMMLFKVQSLVWAGSVMIRLWSVIPNFLKPLMVLSGALLPVLIVWALILWLQQGIQIPRLKSNRILDDFESYLNEQIPSQTREMEATSQHVSSCFPPTVGVQGAEIRAQIEVAKRRCQAVEQRWENDRRLIQDLYLHAGLREEADRPGVPLPPHRRDPDKQVQETLQRIRKAVESRYFPGNSPSFEQTWSS